MAEATISSAINFFNNAMLTNSYQNANAAVQGKFKPLLIAVGNSGHSVSSISSLASNDDFRTVYTKEHGDISVEGDGLLVVDSDSIKHNGFIKSGSFRLNAGGFLEQDGVYLKGMEYNSDTLTADLQRIKIDRNIILEAEPTKQIDLTIKLNSETIVKGDTGILLSGISDKQVGVSDYIDTAIILAEVTQSKSGEIGLLQERVTFGGFVESTGLKSGDTIPFLIQDTDVQLKFDIESDNNPKQSFEIKGVSISGGTYLDALKQIVEIINKTPYSDFIEARVLDDGTDCSLFINAKTNDSKITFEIPASGGNVFLQGLINKIIEPVSEKEDRFANLEQLSNILKKKNIEALSLGAESIFIRNRKDSMMSIRNVDNGRDLLSVLGVTTKDQGHLSPAYSYLDSRYNMSGGNIAPDYQGKISIFDSKGGKKDIMTSFKKISNTSWAVEVYTKGGLDNSSDLYRSDGLLQAGIMNFDDKGRYINSSNLSKNIINNINFSDPTAILRGTNAQKITINGQDFIFNDTSPDPSASEFNSPLGLIALINSTSNAKCSASIIPNGTKFGIILKPENPADTITIDGDLDLMSVLGFEEYPDPNLTENINIPLLGENLVIDWADTTTNIGQTNAKILINNNSTEMDQRNKISYDADGFTFGSFTRWEIDSQGNVAIYFDNDQSKLLYNIPIALFNAPNNLEDKGRYYFDNSKTGEPEIIASNQKGVGSVQSKVMRFYQNDNTDLMIDMIGNVHGNSLSSTVFVNWNKMQEDLQRALRGY